MSYFSISAVKGLQFFKLCSGKFFPLDPSRGCGISWDRCLVYAYFVASCCLMHSPTAAVKTDDDNVLANTIAWQ